jgi:hypothetical protein
VSCSFQALLELQLHISRKRQHSGGSPPLTDLSDVRELPFNHLIHAFTVYQKQTLVGTALHHAYWCNRPRSSRVEQQDLGGQ